MFKRKLSASGTIAITAAAMTLTALAAGAEPYGGFDSVRHKYIRIDYGPRYEAPTATIRYADPPAYVNYQRTYTRPIVQTTRVVYDTPVVEYVAPVRYRRVYAAPRRVLHISPVAHFTGYHHRHHPRGYYRHHGVFRHFRPHRYFGHYRHHRYHPRGWGFSIGLGRGYGGHHGGFSFYYAG